MAIESSKLHWEGWTGTRGSNNEWTAVYRVRTTDPNDGPKYVTENYGGPLPNEIGYSIGNDSDADAICKTVVPSRIGDSRLDWFVAVTFTSGPGENGDIEKLDNNGKTTKDPLQWKIEFERTPVKYTGPVEIAWNVDPIPGRPMNTKGPVTSSAFEVFDPPPERDFTRWLYTISANFAACGVWDEFQDAVNSDDVVIRVPSIFGPEVVANCPKYTLKVESVSLSLQHDNGQRYWKRTVELLYRKDTWRPEYLDKGFTLSGKTDKPDGYGGTYADEQNYTPGTNTPVYVGIPQIRQVRDAHGYSLHSPIMLDAEGGALDIEAPAKYFRWRIYDEMALQPLVSGITGA